MDEYDMSNEINDVIANSDMYSYWYNKFHKLRIKE